MNVTPYSDIDVLLNELLTNIQYVLGDKLFGLYLYGSLVWGDFDHKSSDIDLLAVLLSDVTEKDLQKLQKMHEGFITKHKEWINRIEIQYLSFLALKTFKSKTSKAVTISPGESLHIIEVGKHWLMNWYMVQEKGKILYGPDPKTIIAPISKEEFIQSVKDHTKSWDEWVKNMRTKKAQAYAILTMCRALYAYKTGEQTSKKQAAEWAEKELPQWAPLIKSSLLWRQEKDDPIEDNENYPKTEQFVSYVRKQILET